jgi:hypothetical protein
MKTIQFTGTEQQIKNLHLALDISDNDLPQQTAMSTFQETLEAMYLDYVNNFLTVGVFASYYGISEELATAIINEFQQTKK